MAERREPAFIEPGSRLTLRWGRYRDRLGWGCLLITSGTIALAGADTYQLLILLAGTVACVAGWAIVPSEGWRRVAVALPATLAGWLLLAGPRFVAVLLLPYLGWLLVRHRPAASWLTVLFPLATAMVIAELVQDYDDMLPALGAECVALVVSALVARSIAAQRASRRGTAPSA